MTFYFSKCTSQKTVIVAKILSFCLTLLFVFLTCGCNTTTKRLKLPPLQTVEKVDLNSYLGLWYEIARFPNRFQKRCVGSTARYSLRDDGKIDVLNKCFLDSHDGKQKEAKGIARIVDTNSNSKLEVSFFRPFWGEYWIIILDDNYSYAVVGHPSRDYLWILSRKPQMDDDTYKRIINKLKAMSYPTERFIRTTHGDLTP